MSIKSMLLPLAALAGSAAFLIWQHYSQDPVRQQATLFRETIQAVATHRTETKAKAEAAQRAETDGKGKADATKTSRADIDLKEMAKLMDGMRNGTMPDMKAMLKLQKTIMDLSPEELSALIGDAGKLELPAEQRQGLVMMLLQGLAESDPKSAVIAAAEFMKNSPKSQFNMISFPMQQAFSSWAKKDLAGALAWFDGAVAAGQFESTALTDENQEHSNMLGSVLQQLWEKDPAAARQRLLALSDKERAAVLSGADGFQKDEASQKQFSELARSILPEKEQANALKQLAERIYSGEQNLESVTKFLTTIEATPEERKTLVAGLAETSIRQRTWGNSEKPNLENTTKLRTWLTAEDSANSETVLGKSIAVSANSYGSFNSKEALALVTELHTAQPSDALLVSFLEQAKQNTNSNKEAFQALAGKITDPAARAAVLEKLAKP